MINLTTLAHVRRLLSNTDASFDNDLQNRITDVSYRAQSVYSIDLERQTYVEIKDGGGRYLFVDNPPIVSVTSVVSSDDLQYASGEVVPATEYAIVNRGWDVAHQSRWPGGPNAIQITYIGGYLDADNASTTLPRSLQEAIARQVAYEFEQRKSIGLTTVDFPDGSITKETESFLKSVKIVLDKTLRKTKIG